MTTSCRRNLVFLLVCFALHFFFIQASRADDGVRAPGPVADSNDGIVKGAVRADSSDTLLPPDKRKRLRNIDAEVILECIDFARFNVNFHEEANKHWKWRSVLYPLAKESSTALSFANVISNINQRGRSFGNVSRRSNAVRRRGLYTTATGKVIGGTASALELTQNGIVCMLAAKKGYSPKKSVDFVLEKRERIDKLLRDRDRIIDLVRQGDSKRLLKLESMLMRRIENRLIREFKRWSALSREQMWNENVFFALDVSQNSINFSNNVLSLGSVSHPSNVRTASILGLVAKSISTLNPVVRSVAGKIVRRYQKSKLDRLLPQDDIPSAENLISPFGEEEALLALAADKSRNARQLEEFALIVKGSQKADDMVEKEVEKIEKLRRVATQQTISGPLIGLTALAQKILVVVSVYGDGDANTNNQLRFAGRISQASGQAYSLVNTPTTQVLHYLKNRSLKREGRLPAQVFQQRREKLNQVEKKVRGWIVD